LNLSLCREPIAFELLGTHKKITAQFAAGESDAPLLRRQLSAFFPEAVFVPREGALVTAWETTTGDEVLAVEFGDPVKAMALTSYGNSSQPGSPHNADQLPLLSQMKLRPALLKRADVEANLESRDQF